MSGKALKRNSYWLRERNKKQTDVEKCKLEELHTIENLSKKRVKLRKCSFVEECGQKALQKKIMENFIKCSKTSKDFTYSSKIKKF